MPMMTSETTPSAVPWSVRTWEFRMSPRVGPAAALPVRMTSRSTSRDSDSMINASGPSPATPARAPRFAGPENRPRPARVNALTCPPSSRVDDVLDLTDGLSGEGDDREFRQLTSSQERTHRGSWGFCGPGSVMMTPPVRRRAWTARNTPITTAMTTTAMINHHHHCIADTSNSVSQTQRVRHSTPGRRCSLPWIRSAPADAPTASVAPNRATTFGANPRSQQPPILRPTSGTSTGDEETATRRKAPRSSAVS